MGVNVKMEPFINIEANPEYGVWLRFLLPGGKQIDLNPMTYGKMRLNIGAAGSKFYDNAW